MQSGGNSATTPWMESVGQWLSEINWMEWAAITFNLIGRAFWPAVVLIGLLVYRDPIVRLLGRLREFSHGDTKVRLDLEEQQRTTIDTKAPLGFSQSTSPENLAQPSEGSTHSGETNVDSDAVAGLVSSRRYLEFMKTEEAFEPLIEEIEKAARTELLAKAQSRGLTIIEGFLFAFIEAWAQTCLERTYNTILGSQIEAISYCREHGGKAKVEDFRGFYDVASLAYPEDYRYYPFDSWLDYLTRSFIVRREGEDLVLLPIGTALLPFMVMRGYSMHKAG